MKSRKSVALFVLIAVIVAATSLFAAEAKGEKEATASTKVTGEVIDSACYIKSGAKGPNHAECAESCAKAGIPLAILEKGTDKVVWVSADKDMVGANEMLIPF